MRIDEEEELAQVILDGKLQDVMDVYCSRAYGWMKKCGSLDPSEIDKVIALLNLNETDAAAVTASALEAVLSDIEEHEEYSEDFGGEEAVKEKLEEIKKKIQHKNGFEWEYLYQLAGVAENGHACFWLGAKVLLTDTKQVDLLMDFYRTEISGRPNFILNIEDFSFFSPLLDEAILSMISPIVRCGAANTSTPKEQKRAEENFAAFEYYISKRPLPICFGSQIIGHAIQLAAKWGNKDFAQKVGYYIDKIQHNVNTYTSLSGFYASYLDREKLIENLKLAEQYGALEYNFGWAQWTGNTWEGDDEIQNLIPKSIHTYLPYYY